MEHPADTLQQTAAPAPRSTTSGIVAVITGVLGLFALPLIGSILALVFGYQSRREAQERPDLYVDDLGTAGRVLGWIGLGLVAFGLTVVIAVLLFLMPVWVG